MSQHPVIALISAVPASIPPTRAAFADAFPDAELWNLLDDRLLEDATEQGGLTPHLELRMQRLIDHARTEGAAAVLLTCSLYAPVAHDVAVDADIPVLAPDDAVFAAVRDRDYQRILLISSGADPLQDSVTRLSAFLGGRATVDGALATDAVTASRSGDVQALAAALLHAIDSAEPGFDAVVLGQYSLSPAAKLIEARLSVPVLAGPQFAVDLIHTLISKEKS